MIASIIKGAFTYEKKRLVLKHEYELQKEEAEKQRALNNFINRFFSFIANEFKTPLSIILGIYDEIKHDVKIDKSLELLDSAKKEGYNMLEMIDEMIDITKLNNNTFELRPRTGNIGVLIQSVVDSFKPLASIHQIELQEEIDTEINARFDSRRIRYIINNLLSNALRFTPKNGWIQVKVDKTADDQVFISVKDSGQGISQDAITHIFKPDFTTTTDDENEDIRHFGLGLAFVKEIVQKMGGTLDVESQPGMGALFKITLPLVIEYDETSPEIQISNNTDILGKASVSVETDSSEIKDNLPIILVVDDNPSAIKNIVTMVNDHYNVLIAKDGETAFQMAKSHIPDMIITDVIMPGVDGLELTQMIKNDSLTNHIPVIIISSRGELEDRLKGQASGADFYLQKPVYKVELLMTLKNLHDLQTKWKLKFKTQEERENEDADQYPADSVLEEISTQKEINDHFMNQLYEIFEQNCSKESFDTDELCKILHISRAQLYRKISAVSDQGAMELLRNYRLEKAFRILKENPDLSTKEIAFKVGFKERSHFSNLFTKKYGYSPSELKRKN